jgi:hypothetical protein
MTRKKRASPRGERLLAQATRMLRKWQHIVRLEDWDIAINFGRWHEVHEEAVAHCHYSRARREAHLVIRHPDDWGPETWAGDNDMELTIVHELLHLKLSGLDNTDATKQVEEALVEQMARSLVRLKRGEL